MLQDIEQQWSDQLSGCDFQDTARLAANKTLCMWILHATTAANPICISTQVLLKTTMPTWWSQYNRTKHDLPKGYVAGSIENTYLALAGLYVLHFMTSQLERGRESFLTQDCWVSFMPIEIDRYDPEAEIRKGVRPKSDVFVPLRECMFHRRSRLIT